MSRCSCHDIPAPLARATTPWAPVALAAATLLATAALGTTAALAGPAAAQDEDRIWGRVLTVSGDRYEGFLQWRGRGANDGTSWVDFFEGRAEAISQHYEDWLAATETSRPVRTIEARGWRVSWNEEHPDFPLRPTTPIRFGRLASVVVREDGSVDLELRAGGTDPEMRANAAERNPSRARQGRTGVLAPPSPRGETLGVARPHRNRLALVVEEPGGDRRRLAWGEIERVDFAAPPPGVRPEASRLHGTVEDRFGRAFTGYVAWDSDEVLGDEELDGRDQDGEDREIALAEIASIERSLGGARVVLKTGEALEMHGTNDVDDGNRGVRVFDPSIGMVEVEWDEFGILRLHPPADGHAEYGSFPGSRALVGTITTQDGETIAGRIRWDAEHEWSWEVFEGRSDEVKFAIEFGRIERIKRGERGGEAGVGDAGDDEAGAWDDEPGARVTLVDGRSFFISHSPDLEEGRGIFVFPDGDPGASWRYVPWEEFREVRFWDADDGGSGS